MKKKTTIDIITLGCSKNLVDSERLIAQLEAAGYEVTHDSDDPKGEIAVVNTCGFIGDAKEESINMILQMGQRKEEGASIATRHFLPLPFMPRALISPPISTM